MGRSGCPSVSKRTSYHRERVSSTSARGVSRNEITPLAEVLETLSRWYDVRFETDGQPDRPISYTFATDNTLLDNVLREMELISPVRFERTKTEIKVSFR